MHYLDIELEGLDKKGEQKKYKLSDFKGQDLIVYFYPEDDTPVCTIEAQEFRDALQNLKEKAQIIGVSHNNINDHIDFHNKHNLNFILLSDEKDELKHSFEDHNKYINNMHRTTFILNKDGEIVKYWDKVDIDGHVNEVIEYFEKN